MFVGPGNEKAVDAVRLQHGPQLLHASCALAEIDRLVERLKVGGVLMILDFYSHKKDDLGADPASMTIAHHGFTEVQIKALFEKAGLSDCQVLDFGQDVHIKGHAVRRPFMATGKKVE